MAQSQPPLNLTWRSKDVSHRELLTGLEMIHETFDQEGQLDMAFAGTRDKKVLGMKDGVGNTPTMYRTSGKLMTRSLPVNQGDKETPSRRSAGRSMYLASELLHRASSKVSFSKRAFHYEANLEDQGVKEDDLFKMVIDLALTIKVHPYRLGLKAENKSQVFVPEGCTLKLHTVDDIFAYIDEERDAVKRRDLLGGQEHIIPGKITELSIETTGSRVRAVVVTEHRNIKDVLFSMQGHDAWQDLRGVMVVMTAGFPDWAVREFLCLLSSNAVLDDVPFIWFSDGDSHGLAQYLVCKYGSRSSAFAAPTMVCPRLLFGGMQQSILDDFVTKFPDRTLGRRLKQNPALSEQEQADIRAQATSLAAAKKQRLMSKQLSGSKKKAQKDRLTSIRRAGYLLNDREPEVEAFVRSLEQGGPVLVMSCVSSFDTHGVLFVIRDAVLSALNEEPAEVHFVAQQDSLRDAFVRAAGQAHGQDSHPELATQPTTQVEEEEEFDDDVDIVKSTVF